MTERQRRFCDEYLVDGNATQAAIRAGYSPGTNPSWLMKNLEVRKAIQERAEALHSERIATAVEILEYLTAVMRGEAADIGTRERLRAAEMIGKRYGVFREAADFDGMLPIFVDDVGEGC